MKFNVSPGGLRYTAVSLEDIAQHFDRMAKTAFDSARAKLITKQQARYHEGEGAAYERAADLLRNTTITGATP